MKLMNAEIYNATEPMKKLLRVPLPGTTSYALVQLAHKLRPQSDIIEEVRSKLIAEHGEPDVKRHGRPHISPEMAGFPKFAEELGVLLAQEYDIGEFKVIILPSKIVIEPYVLMALEKFVMLEGEERAELVEVVKLEK